jgi:poly-gamma-glutamate synthesis protein (capsule biosynthesis protein)
MSLILCADSFLQTNNGDDPFFLIKHYFTNSVVFLNLETSLIGHKKCQKNVYLGIAEGQLDFIPDQASIISIVNNHEFDSGNPDRLIKALENRSKLVIGPENPCCRTIALNAHMTDVFSAYFPIPRIRLGYEGKTARELFRLLHNSEAKHKILFIHWGYEHTTTPAPFQRKMAHALIDSGADLIIGHHPHVPQGHERYRGKDIFYSLGNFNFWHFDAAPKEDNLWGYMVSYDTNTSRADVIPYRINENYQPYEISTKEAAILRSRIEDLSRKAISATNKSWVLNDYSYWFKHEYDVWWKQVKKTKSLVVFLKWIVWLLLPRQFIYYVYFMRSKLLDIP